MLILYIYNNYDTNIYCILYCVIKDFIFLTRDRKSVV